MPETIFGKLFFDFSFWGKRNFARSCFGRGQVFEDLDRDEFQLDAYQKNETEKIPEAIFDKLFFEDLGKLF